MKYDNIFLKDLMQEGKSIIKEEEALNERKKSLNQQKKDYIKAYFSRYGIEDLRTLPTSVNTFITSPEFFIRENENGKISWIARGIRTTIKDGRVSNGTSRDEIWQGQWEALPEGIQKLTIDKAKEKSKSVFPISRANFRGTSFAAPAYVLYENEDGFQLVWRKAGTSYVDRMRGAATAPSGLQILYVKKIADWKQTEQDERKAWNKIDKHFQEATGKSVAFSNTYADLTEGGRLSVGLLEKEEKKIDLIFGNGVTQEIIEKLKLQQANKTKTKKELKGITAESEKSKWDDEPDPLKHSNVQPGKLKL